MHFSIFRLLLAVSSFAIAFGAFSYLGFAGIVVSTVIGTSVGIICLVVKPRQIWPMIRTGLATIVGGFIGMTFLYDRHNELGGLMTGGFLGFLIGISLTSIQQEQIQNQNDENVNSDLLNSDNLNEENRASAD